MKLYTKIAVLFAFGFSQFGAFAQILNIKEVQKLGTSVNEDSAEESIPLLSKELGKLFFVRSTITDGQSLTSQNIYESTDNSGNDFSTASELNKLNNGLNNAILGICDNGKKVYLLDMYNRKKKPGIASSIYTDGQWSKPERVEIPDLEVPNTLFGFHISTDEKVIILSYLGSNSLGDEDLYVSLNNAGVWSSPVHLGNKINSKGFEISPFLSDGKDTIFFSSNGFGGLGDADIFYSVKGNSWSDWSVPVNLGAPVNSSGFDAYFSFYNDQVFWASNRNERLSDIYTATLKKTEPVPTIEPLNAFIRSVNSSAFMANGQMSLNIEGGTSPYVVKWMDGSNELERKNLKPGEYSVEVTDKNGLTFTQKATILEPKDDMVKSYVHYFDYNGTSIQEDKKFIELLNDWKSKTGNEKLTIQIVSSASQVPTTKYESNVKLAEKRAAEVSKMISKLFPFEKLEIKINAEVGGPAYENDALNKEKYEKFQFVRISLN